MPEVLPRGGSKLKTPLYLITVFISVLFLVLGNRAVSGGAGLSEGLSDQLVSKAIVSVVDGRSGGDESAAGEMNITSITISFRARITGGPGKGELVQAVQGIDTLSNGLISEVKVGDKILLTALEEEPDSWYFLEYDRFGAIVMLALLFAAGLIVFGRLKGFNTLLSLALTIAAVFAVFIPSILSGHNVYAGSVTVCLYTTVMTILLINGYGKKSLAAIIGCFTGILLAGLLTLLSARLLRLSGITDDNSVYLTFLPTENPIDLKALIFAGIIIGAMGAVMDVAVAIAAAVAELKDKLKTASFGLLFKSGISIGREILGTMANTLVLAYIGSSLSVVLLLYAHNSSLYGLLNREMIIVELLQAIIGSLGILFALPVTSFAAALLLGSKKEREREFYSKEEMEQM